MRKLLAPARRDRLPSVFDRIVAYDGGADEVLSYGGVTEADVRDLVHGAIFTRGPKDLHNTAIFIGGTDMAAGERLLAARAKAFFGPMRVSLMLDSNGCNTTAVAAVVKLVQAAGGDVARPPRPGRWPAPAPWAARRGPARRGGRRGAHHVARRGARHRRRRGQIGARFGGDGRRGRGAGASGRDPRASGWRRAGCSSAGPAGVLLVPRDGLGGPRRPAGRRPTSTPCRRSASTASR